MEGQLSYRQSSTCIEYTHGFYKSAFYLYGYRTFFITYRGQRLIG